MLKTVFPVMHSEWLIVHGFFELVPSHDIVCLTVVCPEVPKCSLGVDRGSNLFAKPVSGAIHHLKKTKLL